VTIQIKIQPKCVAVWVLPSSCFRRTSFSFTFQFIGYPVPLNFAKRICVYVCVCVSSITVFWDVTPCSLIKTVATFRAACCFGHKSAKFYITVCYWKVRQLTVIRLAEVWEILPWSFVHLLVGPGGNASDILAMAISNFGREMASLGDFFLFARSYQVYTGIVPQTGLPQVPSHSTC
jgi:hypothetical protein